MKKNLLFGLCLVLTSSIFSQNWHLTLQEKIDAKKNSSEENINHAKNSNSKQNIEKKTANLEEFILRENFTPTVTTKKTNSTKADFDGLRTHSSRKDQERAFYKSETRYLGENFNKVNISNFPPYGWVNIDHDGDGNSWNASAPSDGYEQSTGAVSRSWYFQFFNQDNWLVTPPLLVKNANDSLKYWAHSYLGNPEYYEVRVSRTKPTVDQFTHLMDSLRFNSTLANGVHRGFSLSKFIGDTIYVAFRHKFNGEGEDRLSLIIDNVEGPEILPFSQDLAIEAILDPAGLGCDLCDKKIVVVVQNLGLKAVENFSLSCASVGLIGKEAIFSKTITDTIQRKILPGDTIHHIFSSALPLSTYDEGEYYVRSFITLPEDQYTPNDTLAMQLYNQKSSTIPIKNGFEADDEDGHGWYLFSPSTSVMKAFTIGENPLFANKGTAYLATSVYSSYDTNAYPKRRGDDAVVATRCLKLENTEEYKLNLYYAFRKFDLNAKEKKLNMRILIGDNPTTLLEKGKIVMDTHLLWDRELVKNGVQASYSAFTSNNFSVAQTGSYYIGFVFYSDDLVSAETNEWMLFVDDISITKANAEQEVDLSLDKVILPFDCNLTQSETISVLIRNTSTQGISNVNVSYTINNGEKIEEIIDDTIHPNTQLIYDFTTLADFSEYKKYRVSATISHTKDLNLSNNENTQITENKSPKPLPYYDGFEEIGTIITFEDAYHVISTGYYTWAAAIDYTQDTAIAYKGVGFLVDSYDNERLMPADDWIIGNCLEFIKDTTYEISFAYRIENPSPKIANLKVAILSSYDTASVLNVFPTLSNIQNADYKIFKTEYTPLENHIGHFAMHSIGQVMAPIIMLDELKIAPKSAVKNEKTIENEVHISPNPATDVVYVSVNRPIEKIELISVLGNTVYSKSRSGSLSNYSINVGHLPKGMYLLVLTTDENQKISKKIILK